MTLKQVIEALVFASPKPLSAREIVSALKEAGKSCEDETVQALAGTKEPEVASALEEIKTDLMATGRAMQLVEKVNGWTFVTAPEAAPWVRQLYPEAKPVRLSGPQLETLSIIAYRQPVTRADIEAVRGVAVDGVMQVLLERGLVKIAGRAEVPGRPLLYETTEYFLQHFGLKSTDDLPNAQELRRVALPKAETPAEEGKEKAEGKAEKTEAQEGSESKEEPKAEAAPAEVESTPAPSAEESSEPAPEPEAPAAEPEAPAEEPAVEEPTSNEEGKE